MSLQSLSALTPVPSSVTGVAAPVMDLGGSWEFSALADGHFKPIRVPGEWAMQGFSVPEGKEAVYRKSFVVPEDWKDHAAILRFDAVHAVCSVAVNGVEIGGHEGGFVPFELDAARAVKPGRNELTVRVRCESVADSIACASQYAGHPVGGILREVRVFCVPGIHLTSLWHETELAADEARLTLHATTAGETEVTHRLLDPQGREVAAATGNGGDVSLTVRKPLLWTSETPNLYVLETSTGSETVRTRIGLRTVEVKGNRLLVNGAPVKLLGVNRHEVHPLTGRAITPELCRRDAELFRAANVNLVRTSHYPPSAAFLEACDELGIFVECEAAVCWIEHHASPAWKEWNHLDEKYLPYFRNAALDMVAACRSHPSVIIWSIANESLWSPLFADVLDAVKQADPTRPVTFHDQCWGGFNNAGSKADIAVYHYPDENHPGQWSAEPRPVWFGEYAHVECYNRRELLTDPGIRSDWGRPFERMVELMRQQPGCLGGAIWSGIDDVFQLPDGTQKGYGHWGVIDAWRREKPEFQQIRRAYSPVRLLETRDLPDGAVLLKVENRFNFTDLRDVTVRWSQKGGKGGLHPPPAAPGAAAEITVPCASGPLTVSFTDPRGVTVAEFTPRGYEEAAAISNKTSVPRIVDDQLMLGDAPLTLPLPVIVPLDASGGAAGPAGSVLGGTIEPLFALETWTRPPKLEETGGGTVSLTGETESVKTTVRFTPDPAGGCAVSYEATLKRDVNPRQWGLVFTLPRNHDHLSWDCRPDGFTHDENDLARPRGSTRALAAEKATENPRQAWRLDSTPWGSADFRATRARVRMAELSDDAGRILRVSSPDATQAVRAWVDGCHVRLLVAGFHTGGADEFFATHYSLERRPLKSGETVRSSFILHLFP